MTRWQPGDPVFGEADAALADYVVAPQELVAPAPAGASFPQAAALPLAANTALMCLRAGDPTPGAHFLINEASGEVGTFTVQIAKTMGLHVTAVCSARNADLARSLGVVALLPGPRIVTPQALPSTERLEELAGLVASGSVTPVIDRVFDLDHGADALRYLETEHARAKVIVTIPPR